MTHVTCRLTAKNRDQLRNPTLGNRVWATFLPRSRIVIVKSALRPRRTVQYSTSSRRAGRDKIAATRVHVVDENRVAKTLNLITRHRPCHARTSAPRRHSSRDYTYEVKFFQTGKIQFAIKTASAMKPKVSWKSNTLKDVPELTVFVGN